MTPEEHPNTQLTLSADTDVCQGNARTPDVACRAPDCRRVAVQHFAFCEAHVGLLLDRVIRGAA